MKTFGICRFAIPLIAGILVAVSPENHWDLFDTQDSWIQWAERIVQKIDNVTADEKVKS